MILYHGTSERYLDSILKDGLCPRGRKRGNWKHTVTSNPNAVYLTNAYPLHFAGQASRKKDKLAVLEIETQGLDNFLFAPDEDWLEQTTRSDPTWDHAGRDMKERTLFFRKRALNDFSHLWAESLEGLGTVCYYGVIEAKHIKRVCIIPNSFEVIALSDPTISPSNFHIMGSYYKTLSRRLFDKEVRIPEDDFNHVRNNVFEHPFFDQMEIRILGSK